MKVHFGGSMLTGAEKETPGPIISSIWATMFAALMLAMAALPAAASVVCNLLNSVGGGTDDVSPFPGAGWDVGSGQCNGDFTVVTDPSFAGGALELGMRIEQRSAGQLNSPQHAGIDYEVQTGSDTTQPSATKAWWNFQHSIAYNGVIGDLEQLSFSIRTDEGSFVPTAPVFDMKALRGVIDDRHLPKSTTTYSDIYQTSQNPVFGWFTPGYDLASVAAGAWMLTLVAVEGESFSSVSICAHTVGASCAAPPVAYTCTGFEPPMDMVFKVKKKANRVLPLKMVCTDASGTVLGSGDIAAPIVQVTKNPAGEETSPDDVYLSAGQGTDGNQFVFDGSRWNFNLQTKNFTGVGTYTITAVDGGGDILIGAPTAEFIVQ